MGSYTTECFCKGLSLYKETQTIHKPQNSLERRKATETLQTFFDALFVDENLTQTIFTQTIHNVLHMPCGNLFD